MIHGNINYSNSVKLTIQGVEEKIIDFISGTLGDGSYAQAYLLTEEGNVYMSSDLLDAFRNDTINFKKISNISNICRIVYVKSIYKPYDEEIGDYRKIIRMTFIGIDTKGDCYDLSNVIN